MPERPAKLERLTEAEIESIVSSVREGLVDADEAIAEMKVELKSLQKEGKLLDLSGVEGRTVVRMECDKSSDDVATTKELKDGGTAVMICQSRIMAQALICLKEARKAIAENSEMQGEMREKVL